jgi:hypothetical protein
MGPTIQLIQLSLRVEREAKIQRRSSMAYRDDLADEKTVHRLVERLCANQPQRHAQSAQTDGCQGACLWRLGRRV